MAVRAELRPRLVEDRRAGGVHVAEQDEKGARRGQGGNLADRVVHALVIARAERAHAQDHGTVHGQPQSAAQGGDGGGIALGVARRDVDAVGHEGVYLRRVTRVEGQPEMVGRRLLDVVGIDEGWADRPAVGEQNAVLQPQPGPQKKEPAPQVCPRW